MRRLILFLATIVLVLHFSSAFAAIPDTMQPGQPIKPPMSNASQLQPTPDYLYQQISALKQQVQVLQAQNTLRAVVQITPKGTTLGAENLTVNGDNNLALSSGRISG